MMSPEAKQKIQLALILAMIVAAGRATYIFYQRHEEKIEAEKKKVQDVGYANADYYVNPKKLYPHDLKSARQLTEQPVWVKEGYKYTYYPYNPASKKVDFSKEAGLLLPIEKLAIKDVVTAVAPHTESGKQVMAVFDEDGKSCAVPIGYENKGEYKIYSDEMFFIEDPRELYKHWPPDVWQAVAQHEVKQGMNEMQADFAIGMGVPNGGDTSYEKTVRYPNGGKPVVVLYREGKAAEIKLGAPES